jgi:hypothetical protein
MDEDFIAERSVGRLLLMLAGSILFVILAAWLTWKGVAPGWKYWVIAAGMPFFALCAIYIGSGLFATGPELAVGPRGIMWRRWTGDYVPWTAMTAIRPVRIGNQQMLAITLNDAAAYPLSGLLGGLQSANRSMMGGGDVFLTLVGADRTFGELIDAVERFAPPDLLQ